MNSSVSGSYLGLSGDKNYVEARKGLGMLEQESPLFITSLAKGLAVLSVFKPQRPAMSLSELAEATGLNKSTVQRAIFTLESLGYIAKESQTKRFRLTPKSLEIGMGYLQTNELIERANPYLHELNRSTQESCNLLEGWGSDMIYVSRFASHKQISIHIPLGQKLPMYCMAAGRAFLSALPPEDALRVLQRSNRIAHTINTVTDLDRLAAIIRQAKADGYATSNEEIYMGDLAVGACIVNGDGYPLGAINVSVPYSRWTLEAAVKELAPQVVNTARTISNAAKGIRHAYVAPLS